ncbi:hypothetical protein B0T18DRAFT_393850 [Schizothecium vesticola]|uniref:Dystroglycan-type cadherin-like domain-containing protein n=1 Tax=Schizothecium vesticola TaxID=314040 RepID=A0AA40EKT5_9PEZI|nr:hypothetical protein B0T18DRAFT_393850 [Schizothecium vesticola]
MTMTSHLATWAVLALIVPLSQAAPGISFPINSQVPPVARIGQLFSFVFSPSTFTSPSPITYSLVKSPPWLSIDSSGRRLFGTPGEADVGPGRVVGVPVGLVATDGSGATTLDVTLVVSRSPAPKVNVPFERQAPKFGIFTPPSSIATPPQTQFSFELVKDTFSNPSEGPLNYYAVMADNTPLPAWITFNPATLSISGTTPPSESLIQPPQTFAFQVVASDVTGFSASSLPIQIIVGTDITLPKHEITVEKKIIQLKATQDSLLKYTDLRDNVRVDGKPATADNAAVASMPDIPSWLSVDNGTWHITGTVPKDAQSTSFTVVLRDAFSNSVSMTVEVDVEGREAPSPDLFKSDIPTLTAASGEHFSFNLGKYLVDAENTEISIQADKSPDWVQWDSKATTLSGDVPKGTKDSTTTIGIEAKSRIFGKSGTLALTMRIRKRVEATLLSPSVDSKQPTQTQNTDPASSDSSFTTVNDYNPPRLILLAIVLPVVMALVAVTILLFWCFRRHQEKQSKLTTDDISGPLPGTFVMNSSGLFLRRSSNYGSTQELAAHFHNRHPSHIDPAASAALEKKGYLESRTTYMSNNSATRALATIRLLPPIQGSPSDTDDVFGTGTVPLLPPMVAPLRLSRRRDTFRNTGFSLSTVSEHSRRDDRRSSLPPTAQAGPQRTAGTMIGRPFRDTVESHIPTLLHTDVSSITQTPESAYSPSGSPASRPLRTDSRFGHYPGPAGARGPAGAPTRKFAWPWLKEALTRTSAAVRGSIAHHGRSPSAATSDDTFAAHRRGDPEKQQSQTPSPPRPVTRRGPPTPGPSYLHYDSALPSSPTIGHLMLPSPTTGTGTPRTDWLRPMPEDAKAATADSLGIATPVTRQGGTMAEPGKLAEPERDEWSGGGGAGGEEVDVGSGGSGGGVRRRGGTGLRSGSAPVTGVGGASPTEGKGGDGDGSRDFGSELGSVLLSPDKWPKAEGHGKGTGTGGGEVRKTGGRLLGKQPGRSHGMMMSTVSSKGDESDYAVYI